MRPLSIYSYFINNKRKFFSIFITILLCVFLQYSLQVFISSSSNTLYKCYVEPSNYAAVVISTVSPLSENLVRQIQDNKATENMTPAVLQYVSFSGLFNSYVIMVKPESISYLLGKFDMKLRDGRLPDASKHEIIMQTQLAAAKKVKIGDKVGSKVIKEDALPGEYTVVGLLDGPVMISFAPIDAYQQDLQYKLSDNSGFIILPKAGQINELNNSIESLKMQYTDFLTMVNNKNATNKQISTYDFIFYISSGVLILIVSICVGLLCYLYFYQRRYEFGILNAIGYKRSFIIKRAFVEISSLNFIGFAIGIILALIFCYELDNTILIERGIMLTLWDPGFILRCALTPVFVTLFSLLPVWIMLKRIDSISIIEGGA